MDLLCDLDELLIFFGLQMPHLHNETKIRDSTILKIPLKFTESVTLSSLEPCDSTCMIAQWLGEVAL